MSGEDPVVGYNCLTQDSQLSWEFYQADATCVPFSTSLTAAGLLGHSWALVGSLPMCGALPPLHLSPSVVIMMAAALTSAPGSPILNMNSTTPW